MGFCSLLKKWELNADDDAGDDRGGVGNAATAYVNAGVDEVDDGGKVDGSDIHDDNAAVVDIDHAVYYAVDAAEYDINDDGVEDVEDEEEEEEVEKEND